MELKWELVRRTGDACGLLIVLNGIEMNLGITNSMLDINF